MVPAFRPDRRWFLGAAVAAGWAAVAPAQPPLRNEPYRRVEAAATPGDKPDIWTLDFEYIPIRIITLDVPGLGRHPVWYMPYRIYNRTKVPQQVTSLRFELVTKDLKSNHTDEPQPTVFDAVRAKEDPDRTRPYQTTVGIARERIPVTRPDSYPRYVYGIAIWTDVPANASQTNRFSVYVTGLSDGLTTRPVDPGKPDGDKMVAVKTLQLDFFKPTDANNPAANEIKPEDNRGLGGERWLYRDAARRPAAGEKKDEGK